MLVVLALALSLVAPIAAATTSSSASIAAPDHDGPPSGMVGVPGEQVGPPDHAGVPGQPDHAGEPGPPMFVSDRIPSHAGAWQVHADKHAGDLAVEVGALESGELALRLTDDVNHDGREVALDRSTLVDALGHAPQVAHGIHESGDRWTSPIRYEGSHAVFTVDRFSTNTITFDGEVVLEGTPATDGTSYQYDLDSAENIDNFSIGLEGVESTSDTKSVAGSVNGTETTSLNIDGNRDPVGPDGGDPTLSLAYDNPLYYDDTVQGLGGGSGDYITFHVDKESNISYAELKTQHQAGGGTSSHTSSMYLAPGDIGSSVLTDEYFVNQSYGSASEYDLVEVWNRGKVDFNTSGNGFTVGIQLDNANNYNTIDLVERSISAQPDVSATVTSARESVSVNSANGPHGIDIPSGNSSLEIASDGPIDWTLDYQARSITEDPTVTINGESIGYSGVLALGETTTLSPDPSWLTSGTNTVGVSTANASGLSSNVKLNYRHSASVDQSISYVSETWSEKYNVSRTWDSATTDASVTIPFASDRVVAIRDVEARTNGGSWSELSSDNYALDGTTLEASIGDVSEGDEISIRANGSKVKVENGAIDVLEPTTEGNSLDTALEIVDYSESFGIDVGGTSEGNWIHKTANESWTAPETHVTVTSSGGQTIRAPGASAGSTMHVRTMPLEVNPNAGSVDLQLLESDRESKFAVDPSSSTTEVEYRWHDTVSGDKYVLYSETHGVARDSATAQSPVSLIATSYVETLSIIHDAGTTSEPTSTGGGGGGAIGTASTAAGANPLLTLVVAVIALAGTALLATRTEIDTRVVAGVGFLVVVLGLEIISPGTITEGIRSAIVMIGSGAGPVVPLVILIVVASIAYSLIKWVQGRSGPDTQVTYQLGGKKK